MPEPGPPKPKDNMLQVDYEEILHRAHEMNEELDWLSRPPQSADPPCLLPEVIKATQHFASNAEEIWRELVAFRRRKAELSQALRYAALAYDFNDWNAAKVISQDDYDWNDSEFQKEWDKDHPSMASAMLGAPGVNPLDPIELLHSLEDTAQWIEQGDQGKTFESSAVEWEYYALGLKQARNRLFRDFDHWHGAAANTVQKNLVAHRDWLTSLSDSCNKMSTQADSIVKAFRKLRENHVVGEKYDAPPGKTLYMKYEGKELHMMEAYFSSGDRIHTAYETFMRIYNGLSQSSEQLLAKFRVEAELPVQDINPRSAPDALEIEKPTPFTPWDKPDDMDIKHDHNLKPPPRPDDRVPDPPPPTPSGGGSGMPMMPAMPAMPAMPSMPSKSTPPATDPALSEALKNMKGAPGLPKVGGGVKAASFGGAGTPLQPPTDTEASRPAAGPGRGNLGRGVPGGGAMGGGMGGAPGHGAGKDGSKGKRVEGEDDESLYTEDRAWTEGVVGLPPRAKDVPK
jgi:hypothetical protein